MRSVQGLIAEFYKGYVKNDAGGRVAAYIAITPFDTKVVCEGSREIASQLGLEGIVITESIASVDLAGVDREGMDVIVRSILEGGYLARPGLGRGGDAVLFTLVNEAVQFLEETAADFSLTE